MLIKNFNQDRGLHLAEAMWGKHAKGATHQQDFHNLGPQQQAVHRAASRVLDLCEHVAIQKGDRGALAALQKRTPFYMTAARSYSKGTNTLPHHVDGIGGWVVLFSFGLTVDFFVGHRTVCIESGDALVFNGGPAHGVVHGFTYPVRTNATLTTKEGTHTKSLAGMSALDDLGLRISVQARMQ